jgi:ribosomal protein S18 acetylase RimI-like enzyme
MLRRYSRSPQGSTRFRIRLARCPSDVAAVRSLFLEYRTWLAEHREVTAFDDAILRTGLDYFDREIENLPGDYGLPRGALFLACAGASPVGCGALRELPGNVAELKRVYVRPAARGKGLGRRITRVALNRARRSGYQRVVLDTLPTMTAAIAIYRSMGFAPIGAYWSHPVEGALFFQYRLRAAPRRPAGSPR